METTQTETKNETKHDPGPWSWGPLDTKREPRAEVHSEFGIIARVLGPETDGRNNANARLIAAAPELLEALKISALVIHSTVCGGSKFPGAVFERCPDILCRDNRAAIAKAEGR